MCFSTSNRTQFFSQFFFLQDVYDFAKLLLLVLITALLFSFRNLFWSLSSASSSGILLSVAKLGGGVASLSTQPGYSVRSRATTASFPLKKSRPFMGVPAFMGNNEGSVEWE